MKVHKNVMKGWKNVNPERTTPQGKCLAFGCQNLRKAKNLCNKHYLKQYFAREPKSRYEKGRRGLRKTTMCQDIVQFTGMETDKAEKVVTLIFRIMSEALQKKETIYIGGFGTFKYNPHFSDRLRSKCNFTPAKELRYMVQHPDYRSIK